MALAPDTKNWTWVLQRPCEECGFDASTVPYRSVSGLLRHNAAQWPLALRRADVRERVEENRWSALEYGAHVRDVCRVFDTRLNLMLSEDGPTFPNWDQDAAAIADDYAHQNPAVVSEELVESAAALADAFAAVPGDRRERTGRRSDGAQFTVITLARYFIHEPVHHLWDVTRDVTRGR